MAWGRLSHLRSLLQFLGLGYFRISVFFVFVVFMSAPGAAPAVPSRSTSKTSRPYRLPGSARCCNFRLLPVGRTQGSFSCLYCAFGARVWGTRFSPVSCHTWWSSRREGPCSFLERLFSVAPWATTRVREPFWYCLTRASADFWVSRRVLLLEGEVARRRPRNSGGVVSGLMLRETRSPPISDGERGCRSPSL